MLLSVSWVVHEYRMGTWPGETGRGERFGGHGGGGWRAGWVMSRVGNDRGGEEAGGGKVRWESAGGGDRLDPVYLGQIAAISPRRFPS